MLMKRNLRDAFPDMEVLLLMTSSCTERGFFQVYTDQGQVRIHNEPEQEWDIRCQIKLDKILPDFSAAKMRKQFISV